MLGLGLLCATTLAAGTGCPSTGAPANVPSGPRVTPTPIQTPQEWWRAFQARDESFNCSFPALAQSRYKPDKAGPGAYQVAYLDRTGPDTGRHFSASWICSPKPTDLSPQISELTRDRKSLGQREFEQEGQRGMELKLLDEAPPGALSITRLLPGKGRIFQVSYLMAPAPDPDDPVVVAQAKAFFDSFHANLERSPVEDPPVPIEWKPCRAKDGSFTCELPVEFHGQVQGHAYSGGCLIPGRLFQVDWQASSDSFETVTGKVLAGMDVRQKKAVQPDGYQGFELLARGSFLSNQAPGTIHALILVGSGRVYTVLVEGLPGDRTLQSDARKVFASFKPAKWVKTSSPKGF